MFEVKKRGTEYDATSLVVWAGWLLYNKNDLQKPVFTK